MSIKITMREISAGREKTRRDRPNSPPPHLLDHGDQGHGSDHEADDQ